MNVTDLKEHIYDFVADYFRRATVVWANEYMAKPKYPLVTIKPKTLNIGNMSIDRSVDGEHAATYNASIPVEINLYTKGMQVGGTASTMSSMVNTALEDLMQFVVYLHSPFALNKMKKLDMCMLLNGQVQDLSGLLEDNRYEYRAMCELDVTFLLNFYGAYNTIEKTSSGGGDDDLINAKTGWFEEAEIKYEEETD